MATLTYPDSRPLDRIELPKESARDHLSARLASAYGIDERYADAIARIVVDPTAVRLQIDRPVLKRFQGGTAKFLLADIFTPGVSSSPINPREAEGRVYPVAARMGEPATPLLSVAPVDDRQPAIVLTGDSRAHVEIALSQSALRLREKTDLRDAIQQSGVLEPITIVLAEIRHRDGTPSAAVPISIDGSTRTIHCHDLAEIDPSDVIYKWPQESSRAWRGMLNRILSIQDLPEQDVAETQRAAHRAMTSPARILVGIDPIRGGASVDVVTAIRAIVGSIHVDPPSRWPDGAVNDEIADAILDQLVRDSRIAPDIRAYLAGLIAVQDLSAQGFSEYPDVRAAHIAYALYREQNATSISTGFRNVVSKPKLGRNDKVLIVTELIMRAFRNNLRPKQIDAVRSILERTVGLSEWRDTSQWRVTDRSPDELLAGALAEHGSSDGIIGPSTLELGFLGTYWLIAKQALTREDRGTSDTRAGESVVRAMLGSEHGLRQLHRAIIDGRADKQGKRQIQAVDGQGIPVLTAVGEPMMVKSNWLRGEFSASGEAAISLVGTLKPEQPVDQQLNQWLQVVRRLTDQLAEQVDRMNPYAMSEGVSRPLTRQIADTLRQAAESVSLWGMRYEAMKSQRSLDDLEELTLVSQEGEETE